MKSWTCIEDCGACCKFDLEDREYIYNLLSKNDIKLIKSMTDKEGWCKNLDKKNKKCLIYEERPYFCRVDTFSKNFKEYHKKGDSFLINCCKDHIGTIYGQKSSKMKEFKKSINKK